MKTIKLNFLIRISEEIHKLNHICLLTIFEKGDFDTTVQWKSAFSGGAGGGIGHQNISVRFDYGLDKNSLLSFYVAESDDPFSIQLSNEIFQNSWSVFALNASKNCSNRII